MDWMAIIKAVLPPVSVLSGSAFKERREETVSSDAARAADISGVPPPLVFGCEETVMIMMTKKIIMRFQAILMMMIMMLNKV